MSPNPRSVRLLIHCLLAVAVVGSAAGWPFVCLDSGGPVPSPFLAESDGATDGQFVGFGHRFLDLLVVDGEGVCLTPPSCADRSADLLPVASVGFACAHSQRGPPRS